VRRDVTVTYPEMSPETPKSAPA